jgi:hypothetical protein
MIADSAPRTLTDAISRDLVLAGLFTATAVGLNTWYATTGSPLALWTAWIVLFVLAFIGIYLSHEWGHYLGARAAGANIPLGSGNGILLGLLDPAKHSRRQFMSMALGGEVGYFVPSLIFIPLFWNWPPFQGLAVAGAAFIVQALSVDIPVLWKIHKGDDIQATLEAGTAPPVILRKTAVSWGLLTLAIVGRSL